MPIKKGEAVAPFLPKFIKGEIVKTTAIGIVKITALFAALALTACGGSGSADSLAPTACSTSNLSACGGGGAGTTTGTTSTTTAAVALFTTAPSAVTLAVGGSATYTIGGGTGPYTATSGNTGVVTVGVSGKTLTINGIAASSPFPVFGTTSAPTGVVVPSPIAVVDSAGKSVSIDVLVLPQGTGTPPTISPASLTISDCTTNIPFVFTGGTAPFTILTSDNVLVPVSNVMPVGPNSYFMASLRAFGTITSANAIQTLTVLDGQSRTAVATINVASGHATCPSNPLLQIVATSQNARVSEILAFQITGGVGPYTVTSSDPSIATGVSPVTTSFNAQAIKAGSVLLTVHSSDGQNANITFTVLP